MIRSDLPLLPLAALPGGPEPVVLCATARLAIDLRRAHGELQIARGVEVWQALQSATPAQWLDHLSSRALLRGEIPPASVPGSFLTRAQEASLWEQAIARDAGAAADLFDREGMAAAAIEAASLARLWRIEVPEALQTEEYRAWLRWRQGVAAACAAGGWRSGDEIQAWRIDCIERGVGGLPERLGIAGFIAPDPLLSRLLVALEARGVALFRLDFGRGAAAPATGIELADAEAECLAAADWARQRLAAADARGARPRLRIAVADLPARRRLIEAALDGALHPQQVGAGWAAREREHAFVGGGPLAAQALVDTALRLLQLFVHPQRVAQAEFGALLCAPGWSADNDEADARATIEAELREMLPPETSLARLQRAVWRCAEEFQAPRLGGHLAVLLEAGRNAPRRQSLAAWGAAFGELLRAIGWPGQRSLLPAEREACEALRDGLAGLVALDGMLGRVDAGEALRQLQRHCRDLPFAASRRGAARVEVCALADGLAGAVDGLWVMGLNEGAWPPAPRPNPLLPAELQRRAGVSLARADALATQAQELQAAWCESAAEVVFSWSRREGERPLRASPLLATVPRREAPASVLERVDDEVLERVDDEVLERVDDAVLERVDDARAPPLAPGERIRGGTALLQAQAVCPAWGFYQFRLGAAGLPAPTFGLDARARGSLLHAALEAFWRGRAQADLLAMDAAARNAEIDSVVAQALAGWERRQGEPLPPRLRQLETDRLRTLLAAWLELEARRAPFRVIACEEMHELDIEGLPVRVVIDRVDQLDDGGLVIIDYKSGRAVSADTWADARIGEPQLPIYAALVFPEREVAAVTLARVVADAPAFLGVAQSEGLLPELKSLEQQRRRYAEDEFPDWEALRDAWAERIREVAGEVRDGVAAVVFADPLALQYCEVRPLLRLAERKSQFDEADGRVPPQGRPQAAQPTAGAGKAGEPSSPPLLERGRGGEP